MMLTVHDVKLSPLGGAQRAKRRMVEYFDPRAQACFTHLSGWLWLAFFAL